MCQQVYRMYHFFPEKMGNLGGERGKTWFLNEKENIYYWKIKLGHTEQIWINIIWTDWKRFWGNEIK